LRSARRPVQGPAAAEITAALREEPVALGREPAGPEHTAHVVPFCKASHRVEPLRARLARLAPLDREMLELAYFTGASPDAIALRYGVKDSEVRSRLRRALSNVSQERQPRSKEATT
jgi:DNA-directed RNA polymerase specialized sigma24 family protein